MVGPGAIGGKGQVGAASKYLRKSVPGIQGTPSDEEFGTAVFQMVQQVPGEGRFVYAREGVPFAG
ncbi:hypothetical protein A4U49_09080 [Acidithiobacillus ferrivorans]|nr:hypothetical protein A4U49_09080 [Acidithiobacillus ferrivorans]